MLPPHSKAWSPCLDFAKQSPNPSSDSHLQVARAPTRQRIIPRLFLALKWELDVVRDFARARNQLVTRRK
jgi:hypothetical protein